MIPERSVKTETQNLKSDPKFRPKAIPGFSIKVILKILFITGIFSPGDNPLMFIPRECIENPLTQNFETWSTISTKKDINNTFNQIPSNSNTT